MNPVEFLTGGSSRSMEPHYLDWAASAPPYPDILRASAETAAEYFGNPSSRHSLGRASSEILEGARATLAQAVGSTPGQIIFTSGGTEADSIALLSVLVHPGESSIVVSELEHAAVYEQARMLESLGIKVIRVRPDSSGIVQPAALADAVRKDTLLVALMAVNNETGALQPVSESVAAVRAACQDAGRVPFFHCDAVQALGTVPFDVEKLGVDSAAFSAHKTGGPRGVGALFLRRPLQVLVQGGGQENGTRPGTSNPAGAQAFAKAAERSVAAIDSRHASSRELEWQLMDGLRSIRGATVLPLLRNAGDSSYVPNIISMAFPGLAGETMVRLLDEAGVVISTGAACSGSRKERRVLDSMGTDPELSLCAVRISTGRETYSNDIQAFLEHAELAYKKFKV